MADKKKFSKKNMFDDTATSFGVLPDVSMSRSRQKVARKLDAHLANIHTKGSSKKMLSGMKKFDPKFDPRKK